MSGTLVVLDAGVVDRATSDRAFRWTLRELVSNGWDPVIPTVVLAETLTGGPADAPANQAIRRIGTVPSNEATARLAGRLRSAAIRAGGRRPPSGIDALVAAHAASGDRAIVFTTDPSDLRRLLVDRPDVEVAKP